MYSQFEPVVIASDQPLPDHVFTGYAFVGPHIIVGADGFNEWSSSLGNILNREDGCYFYARRVPKGLEVSADFKGYAKIYIYESDKNWAVSNSFARLVDAVRRRGWSVTPNETVLATWSRTDAFWQQLATFETAALEISVMPRQNILTIESGGRVTQEAGSQAHPENRPTAYQSALRRFLNTWIGRMGTCIREPGSYLSAELTGGLDSRVTLSLLLGLRQYFPVGLTSNVSLQSSTQHVVDLNCAQKIADTYRLRLNTPLPAGEQQYIDPYERWRDISLGSYAPHYWPSRSYAINVFKVGGHGGEGHRSYWPYKSPHDVLDKTRDAFRSDADYEQAKNSFDRTQAVLQEAYPGLPPTVAHYQEFRDRLHSGLHAQNTIRLQPLASKLLYGVARHAGVEALERGQMLYDVMFQLAPGLSVMPYDKDSKLPSRKVIDSSPDPIALNPMRGRVFGRSTTESGPRNLVRQPWVALREDFEEARRRLPEGLVSQEVLDEAARVWKDLDNAGRLRHSKYGAAVQHVMLADLVTR